MDAIEDTDSVIEAASEHGESEMEMREAAERALRDAEDVRMKLNLAREMLDISVELVTSGEHKRRLEVREICNEQIEELLRRKRIRTRIYGEPESASEESSVSEVSNEEVTEEVEETEEVDESEKQKREVVVTEILDPRSALSAEHARVRLETRKQRIKVFLRLKEEARLLQIRNLILQRKISLIPRSWKTLSKKKSQSETSLASWRDKQNQSAIIKEEYRQKLEEYDDLRESYRRDKAAFEIDIEQRRKRRNVLSLTLKDVKESFKEFWMREVTKLTSRVTGNIISDAEADILLRNVWNKLDLLRSEHWKFVMSYDEKYLLEERVTALEECGHGLSMTEYEEMGNEHYKLTDRIDRRKEQLREMKDKAWTEIHVAAHSRDVICGYEEDFEDTMKQLDDANNKLKAARHRVAEATRRRDRLRRKTERIVKTIELTSYPNLLQIFPKIQKTVRKLQVKLKYLKSVDRVQEKYIRSFNKVLNPCHALIQGRISQQVLSDIRFIHTEEPYSISPAESKILETWYLNPTTR